MLEPWLQLTQMDWVVLTVLRYIQEQMIAYLTGRKKIIQTCFLQQVLPQCFFLAITIAIIHRQIHIWVFHQMTIMSIIWDQIADCKMKVRHHIGYLKRVVKSPHHLRLNVYSTGQRRIILRCFPLRVILLWFQATTPIIVAILQLMVYWVFPRPTIMFITK